MALAATLLVLTAVGVHAKCTETLSNYTPRITSLDLKGRITGTTFVLEQPRCNFIDVEEEEDRIWLLVARSSATEKFTLPEAPRNLPYQSFSNNSYYMTLDTAAVNYLPAALRDEITVLRVGTETSCINDTSRPDCNGPLPDPGPYKVQFIARRSNGTMFESRWSKDITLIQGSNYTTISTSPTPLSKGTIALTSILSVLSALLLASFIAILIYKLSDNCGQSDITSVRDAATVTRYSTHHMYNRPTSNS